jgi:class 3 adenylate cyclase
MTEAGYTVLVVDDDKDVCELLVDRLKVEGLTLLTANNGREGLRLIEEKQPDVILMDLKMPDKDGLDVLRECQEKGIHEPVIIITAHATMNHAIEAMKLGAYDFVMKPFSLERVVTTCKQAFETLKLERQAALWQERATNYLHQMYPPEVANSLVQGTLEAKHLECSVLFADVVSSLNYEMQHSPRRSAGALTDYFTLMHEEVLKCGGWVNNFFGDGMMVVFGIPDGSSTHASDAVNAAVRMGQALKASTSPLRQRIGINTGTVLLGDVGSRQKPHYSVIGEVVSVAKRLADMARPGEVLIGSDTKDLSPSFETESIGPVDVKGVGDREIYRVLQGGVAS